MSDTPQTDRFEKTYFDCPTSHVDDVFEYARELERENAALYQALARRSAATMRPAEALTEPEPGRRRIDVPGAIPLSEMKARKP